MQHGNKYIRPLTFLRVVEFGCSFSGYSKKLPRSNEPAAGLAPPPSAGAGPPLDLRSGSLNLQARNIQIQKFTFLFILVIKFLWQRRSKRANAMASVESSRFKSSHYKYCKSSKFQKCGRRVRGWVVDKYGEKHTCSIAIAFSVLILLKLMD